MYFGIARRPLSCTAFGQFLTNFRVCAVLYDNSSCLIGSVSCVDPPVGAEHHGRSHSEQVLCVWGGVPGAPVTASVRDLVCFGGGLAASVPAEVSTWFTRQNHWADRSDRIECDGKCIFSNLNVLARLSVTSPFLTHFIHFFASAASSLVFGFHRASPA